MRQTLLCISIICAAMGVGCAPVMESTRDTSPLPLNVLTREGQGSIFIITSRLEPGPDLIDPGRLKEAFEQALHGAGVSNWDIKVVAGPSDISGVPRVEISMGRLEYTVQAIRMPPGPPCGLRCLFPVMAPALLTRDYLRHEAVVEADVLLHDAGRGSPKHFFLSETATGRTNLFNFGGKKAAKELPEIAMHNFVRRCLSEISYLTR